MKFLLSLLLFGSTLAFAGNSIPLSPVESEGVPTELSNDQMVQVALWTQTTQQRLQDLLSQVESQSSENARNTLIAGIQDAVVKSNGSPGETLTRYILNRALKINAYLGQSDSDLSGSDQQLALMIRSVKLAQKYIIPDLSYLNHSARLADLPFAQFGADFAEFILSVNASTLNAGAQLAVGTYALELLRKDLSQDSNITQYAQAISLVSSFMDRLNSTPSRSDQQNVATYRELSRTYQRIVEALNQSPSVKVSQLQGMTAVAVGIGHSCAIVQGSVFCWGNNDWGQLGDGSLNSSNTPVQAKGIGGATGIAVGEKHSCAVVNGAAYCWGYESVPTGPASAQMLRVSEPSQVPGISNVTAIAAAADHTCAIANQIAYCWGENFANVFPNPDAHLSLMKDSAVPVKVLNANNVTSIAVGADHICLLNKGQVLCAGNGLDGGLGHDPKGNIWADKPVKPDGVGKSQMINTTGLQTCAVSGKDLYCWGAGIYEPIKVGLVLSDSNSSIALSYRCTDINGMSLCWDQNQYRPSVQNDSWRMSEIDLTGLNNVQALELGIGHVSTVAVGPLKTCAVITLASGFQQLYCWGGGLPMTHVEAFDHLNLIQYPSNPKADSQMSGLSPQQEKDLSCMQKLGFRQDADYSDQELKVIHDMCQAHDEETESYVHPVKCAGKRLFKGLLLGPFSGGGDC